MKKIIYQLLFVLILIFGFNLKSNAAIYLGIENSIAVVSQIDYVAHDGAGASGFSVSGGWLYQNKFAVEAFYKSFSFTNSWTGTNGNENVDVTIDNVMYGLGGRLYFAGSFDFKLGFSFHNLKFSYTENYAGSEGTYKGTYFGAGFKLPFFNGSWELYNDLVVYGNDMSPSMTILSFEFGIRFSY
jgi:hypothetical protein